MSRSSGHARRNLLEQLQPLASQGGLETCESGDVPARSRVVRNKAASDRIGHVHEHNRERASFPQQCGDHGSVLANDNIGPSIDQLLCKSSCLIGTTGGPTNVDLDIAAVRPTQLSEPIQERPYVDLS
jgi:hypothetical protein